MVRTFLNSEPPTLLKAQPEQNLETVTLNINSPSELCVERQKVVFVLTANEEPLLYSGLPFLLYRIGYLELSYLTADTTTLVVLVYIYNRHLSTTLWYMERPRLATFSSSSYFDDRGPHGYAQPITEHVNVGICALWQLHLLIFIAPLATYSFILLPKRSRRSTLWCKYVCTHVRGTFDTKFSRRNTIPWNLIA